MNEYRVALEVYDGPLDLLLFLIRREEVDILDIPIARITEQYVAFVALLEKLDPNVAGEFLVLAATLMEIKSRMLLPSPPPEDDQEDDLSDPRLELVRQLLAYKKFKDASHELGAAAELQRMRHGRQPTDVGPGPDETDLESMHVWDLMEAFQRLMEQTGRARAVFEVGVDDTPVALHAADVVDSLQREGGSQHFENLFAGRSRSRMIGLFLALLELIRQRRVRVTQDRPFGPITIHLLDARPLENEDEFDQAPTDPPSDVAPPGDDTEPETMSDGQVDAATIDAETAVPAPPDDPGAGSLEAVHDEP